MSIRRRIRCLAGSDKCRGRCITDANRPLVRVVSWLDNRRFLRRDDTALNLITFDPFRTLDIPGVRYIKPERYLEHLPLIEQAHWLLFPQYWQLGTLLYGLGGRVFPSPASYYLGHTKVEQTRVLQALFPDYVPETLILASTAENRCRVPAALGYPFVAKAIKASQGHGVWLIEDAAQWAVYAAAHDVLYAQRYLPITRDLRVVLIGKRAAAAYWRINNGEFHSNVSRGGTVCFEEVPAEALALVETVAARLGIDHAGFDLCRHDGHWYLFEFNRLFGNQGLRELGIRPGKLIHDYLRSQSQPGRDPTLPHRGGASLAS